MENKYYAVTTKCGHVGRGKYTEITFPIAATCGKEAAFIARYMPRVKHDLKYAIVDCVEVTYDEYMDLKEINSNNPYLQCKNIQEQNLLCEELYLCVHNLYEKESNNYYEERQERLNYKERKNRILEIESRRYINYMQREYLGA